MKKLILAAMLLGAFTLAACNDDAHVASQNLSKAADNFEINRRIVFYNGISGEYILTVEGLCSLDNASTGKHSISVTCKTGPGVYKKHFLGVSDNVTWFAEQLEPVAVSKYFYRVTFKPSTIIPDIRLQ